MRAQLTDGTNALAAMQANMERYYQDNRTYASYSNAATSQSVNPPCVPPTGQTAITVGTFTISCQSTSNAGYTVQAIGSGQTNGFTYTIDQDGTRATLGLPSADWGTVPCNTAWIVKKGQTCPATAN
ncbi:MAG: type IV pilin protein [Burkholderiaceae bacterium]|nr:type IV pilin protein [Burkholderiaceae bacterium]